MPKIKARQKSQGAVRPTEAPKPAPANLPLTGDLAPEPPVQLGLLINETVVGDGVMRVHASLDGLVAVQPGVAGTDTLPEIPEQVFPFLGYAVPMSVTIKEANGIAGSNVVGICKWQITMNGVLVYSPRAASTTLRDALFEAGYAVQKLVQQMEQTGIRWWDERSWQRRHGTYMGQPVVVLGFEPWKGEVHLLFPPDQPGASPSANVDILDPHLILAAYTAAPDDPMTASDTVESSTEGGAADA